MGEHEWVSDAVENLFEIRVKANASFLVLRDLFFYPSSRAVIDTRYDARFLLV
jgi:hypothetical protein